MQQSRENTKESDKHINKLKEMVGKTEIQVGSSNQMETKDIPEKVEE